MAMAANEIEELIKAALPDAQVSVEDLAGDGDHYAATVVSERFRGLPRIKRHQTRFAALQGRMGGACTLCALQTSAPTDDADARRLARRNPMTDMTDPVFDHIQSMSSGTR